MILSKSDRKHWHKKVEVRFDLYHKIFRVRFVKARLQHVCLTYIVINISSKKCRAGVSGGQKSRFKRESTTSCSAGHRIYWEKQVAAIAFYVYIYGWWSSLKMSVHLMRNISMVRYHSGTRNKRHLYGGLVYNVRFLKWKKVCFKVLPHRIETKMKINTHKSTERRTVCG